MVSQVTRKELSDKKHVFVCCCLFLPFDEMSTKILSLFNFEESFEWTFQEHNDS